jgi:hypothetical protein
MAGVRGAFLALLLVALLPPSSVTAPALQCFVFDPGNGPPIFEVCFESSETPVFLERSADLVHWTNALYSSEGISSTNHLPWAFGEAITNGPAFYRLRQ